MIEKGAKITKTYEIFLKNTYNSAVYIEERIQVATNIL